MVTRSRSQVDYSTFPDSDDEPMGETGTHQIQMIDLIQIFQDVLEPLGRVNVGGNMIMYYNEKSGWDHISPDVFVALDVEPGRRDSWKTWVEGKFPDVVFEITSKSTKATDQREKCALYARLGVREYYIYDPLGMLDPAFRCYKRAGEDLALAAKLPSGGIFSEVLGFEFRVIGEWLRPIDPATDQPYPTRAERVATATQAQLAAEQQLAEKEQARLAAEQQLAEKELARRAAEQARLAAEERAARAEAALQAAQAALRKQSPEAPDDPSLSRA